MSSMRGLGFYEDGVRPMYVHIVVCDYCDERVETVEPVALFAYEGWETIRVRDASGRDVEEDLCPACFDRLVGMYS